MSSGGEPSAAPKAIASLAKKPSDVTRQGAQKLKFVPTLPARRKKEEPKQEASQSSVQPSDKGDGRGRGKGRGRGGEGRGTAPRPSPVEMIASGPFAMGPALAGVSARRSTPWSNFTPISPQGSGEGSAPAVSLAAPALKKEKRRESALVGLTKSESDGEVYSEPDEGVEIIDMDNVQQLDWMAPQSLQRAQRDRRRRVMTGPEECSVARGPAEQVDALDLSGDEQQDLEDLVDFATHASAAEEDIRQERLYFFQFPEPFPTFVSTSGPSKDTSDPGPSTLKRKVSFAAHVKSPASATESTLPANEAGPRAPKETSQVDGVIGHVEVYRSGAVKMRLGNGIILNVSEATQPSFLQQAVHLDMENKKLHVLGEISKRFVVSPDLDALLASMELVDASDTMLDDANLIKMDTT